MRAQTVLATVKANGENGLVQASGEIFTRAERVWRAACKAHGIPTSMRGTGIKWAMTQFASDAAFQAAGNAMLAALREWRASVAASGAHVPTYAERQASKEAAKAQRAQAAAARKAQKQADKAARATQAAADKARKARETAAQKKQADKAKVKRAAAAKVAREKVSAARQAAARKTASKPASSKATKQAAARSVDASRKTVKQPAAKQASVKPSTVQRTRVQRAPQPTLDAVLASGVASVPTPPVTPEPIKRVALPELRAHDRGYANAPLRSARDVLARMPHAPTGEMLASGPAANRARIAMHASASAYQAHTPATGTPRTH